MKNNTPADPKELKSFDSLREHCCKDGVDRIDAKELYVFTLKELSAAKAKLERYEKALKEIQLLEYWGGDRRSNYIAREALESKDGKDE